MEHSHPSPDSPPAGIDPAAAPANPLTGAPDPAPQPEPEFGFAPPEHYDPAEYRWVPVRRRPRHDGWTEEKQRRFIEVLADTGLVGLAAKEVGMTRTAAYRLRRAPYAGAFARAWEVARERAGALIEDIAFDRAIEGVEEEVYDRYGALTGSKTIYNDRLLTFLLRHLKPERYGRVAQAGTASPCERWPARGEAAGSEPVPELAAPAATLEPPAVETLDSALRAMEPELPAPAEALFDPEDLAEALLTAEIADGALPQFLAEQRPAKSPAQLRAEALAAQHERGRALDEAIGKPGSAPFSGEDLADWCLYIDPTQAREQPRKRRRKK